MTKYRCLVSVPLDRAAKEMAERLAIGKNLPVMPLWLTLDLCVPLRLEESYGSTCRSLRIPA